jgi:hypothetical protein
VGRLSKFLQLFADIQSCRGNFFLFNRNFIVISVFCLISDGFELVISFGHYCDYCFLCDEDFLLFLLFFCSSVSGVCLSLYVSFLLIGCAGSVGIFWRAGSCIYFVCVSFRCVEWRAGTVLFDHCGGVGGGTVQIFFSGSVVAGTVRLKR